MAENNRGPLGEAEKLSKENNALRQQLREAEEYINTIKKGNIDALVIADKKNLKVYTGKTADKTYRILIEKMNEGAITLNKEGTIIYCNSYFANMMKLPLQKVIGARLNNFMEDLSKEHFEVLLQQGWNNAINNAIKEELYMHNSDGKVVPVFMSLNTLTLDNDVVLSIILTDLTIPNENRERLKRRTSQLEQKNIELEIANKELAFQIEQKKKRTAELSIANIDVKELGDLNTHKENILATLSHDLRTPLAGIIGTAKHLNENFDTLKREDIKELLALLYKASTDELNMLDYLVEWARIKYASEAFTPAKIELAPYVKKVFDTLNENAIRNNLHLHNKVGDDISVFADGKMLLSILQNIVSNSIQHTRAGGSITVTAKRKEDKIIVEVKDTGVGMSKEIREKLFTPQMKSLSSARKENKGAGIGLLLVKEFLEKNKGEIWIESVEGVGSSFYFSLPMTPLRIKQIIETK